MCPLPGASRERGAWLPCLRGLSKAESKTGGQAVEAGVVKTRLGAVISQCRCWQGVHTRQLLWPWAQDTGECGWALRIL